MRLSGATGTVAAGLLGAAAPLVAATAACPEVIAHRGASGYLPEHTLPSYALAYGQGAHWIEPDVVLTADGVAIALHDVTLDRTTDVAAVFADRARDDGQHYAADFSYAEIQRLRVIEPLRGRFPRAARGAAEALVFQVPRFEALLDLVDGLNRATGRRVGVYPELKRPDLQPALGASVLKILAGYDLPVRIQSFDATALAALATDHPRVQLFRKTPLDGAALDAAAGYAAAIGVSKELLRRQPALVNDAHRRNLAVHAYTLRADRLGDGFTSFADEVAAIVRLGVDAVFTDHPDQVLAILGAGKDAACE